MAGDQHPDIESLFRKYLAGTTTQQEVDGLLDHFRSDRQGDELRGLIQARFEQELPDTLDADRLDALVQRMDDIVLPQTTPAPPSTIKRFRKWLPYAAAVAVLLTVGWLLLVVSQKSSVLPTGQAGDSLAASEILPGGNRAVLTLADGRTIDLSSEHEGIVVADGITYLDGTVISPEVGKSESAGDDRHAGLATYDLQLTTPKGGTYQVTLPDGSKVWLNAGSTLKYPSRFSGDSREVFLEGEAYFEIKKQRIKERGRNVETHDYASFNVQTANQVVNVLGTEFNISAYDDDPETKTTLVEGKVKVSHLTSHVSNLLAPGDQSIVRGASIEKHRVEVDQYTAWKSGRFTFDGKPFDEVMRELARWYDLDIQYEGGVPAKEFYGDAFRNSNLAVVLRMLESAELEYRLNRRKLTILNKEKK